MKGYDTIKERNRRAGKDWLNAPSIQDILADVERGHFLRALIRSDIEVSENESRFLESFLAPGQLNWWTPERREFSDRLRVTYGGRL